MPNDAISRRLAIAQLTAGAASLAGFGCKSSTGSEPASDAGRLLVQPHAPTGTIVTGVHPLPFNTGFRSCLYFVPAAYVPGTPLPLALLLHGAGQGAHEMMDPMHVIGEEIGLALLAPDSRSATWDVAMGGFGADVIFIRGALTFMFDHVNIDPARVRIAGFSDGASTALSLGLTNGDLFSRIAAYSPGFVRSGTRHGRPRIFLTHGTQDPILPVTGSRNSIVPSLRRDGYDVEYHEWDGGHGITPALLRTATEWLAAV
jgi:phospholipase/carboxylesterase